MSSRPSRIQAKPPRPKLWLLRPRDEVLARSSHPWTPWYDKVFGLVVRGESEVEARELAQGAAGNEGLGIYHALGCDDEETAVGVWLQPRYTACDVLRRRGQDGCRPR
jgi:hypothetical protein